MRRSIKTIAQEVRADWKNISPYAKPYLDAMSTLDKVDDMYGLDYARSIINYFLVNSMGWRGQVARTVKKELNEMVK
jgi:hypothetical protein